MLQSQETEEEGAKSYEMERECEECGEGAWEQMGVSKSCRLFPPSHICAINATSRPNVDERRGRVPETNRAALKFLNICVKVLKCRSERARPSTRCCPPDE